jgi:hypothetical protein
LLYCGDLEPNLQNLLRYSCTMCTVHPRYWCKFPVTRSNDDDVQHHSIAVVQAEIFLAWRIKEVMSLRLLDHYVYKPLGIAHQCLQIWHIQKNHL